LIRRQHLGVCKDFLVESPRVRDDFSNIETDILCVGKCRRGIPISWDLLENREDVLLRAAGWKIRDDLPRPPANVDDRVRQVVALDFGEYVFLLRRVLAYIP
jgi:hypothetical protein